jgi:fluoride exporter
VTWLLVALGAAVGAPLRYLIDRTVQARHDSVFPWGTFGANVGGSFILGVLTGATVAGAVAGGVLTLVGTGMCGALTTYSTFSYETIRLLEERATLYALLNVGASVIAGLAAAYVGIAIAAAIWP